jgi:hypothetical protein
LRLLYSAIPEDATIEVTTRIKGAKDGRVVGPTEVTNQTEYDVNTEYLNTRSRRSKLTVVATSVELYRSKDRGQEFRLVSPGVGIHEGGSRFCREGSFRNLSTIESERALLTTDARRTSASGVALIQLNRRHVPRYGSQGRRRRRLGSSCGSLLSCLSHCLVHAGGSIDAATTIDTAPPVQFAAFKAGFASPHLCLFLPYSLGPLHSVGAAGCPCRSRSG